MPKTIEKPAAKATAKKTAARKPKASGDPIKKVSEESLKKLQSLDANKQLQSEIEWCLGSYDYDKNPSGLYEAAKRALVYFREEKIKNPKVITAKLIADLEKAIES
jgi:hypothetical protein